MARVKPTRRRGRVSRDDVVAAAVAIVDRDGFESLTLRRLGAELDLDPMGVYRHVRDKDELLELVLEEVLARFPWSDRQGRWDDRLRALLRELRTLLVAHPGVVDVFVNHPTAVPSAVRLTEEALSIVSAAGFEGADAVMAYDAAFMFTIGSVMWELPRFGGERERLVKLSAAMDEESPELASHAAHVARRDADNFFDFGLEAMIAGLDRLRRRRS